jgi:hypothetical protein
MPKKTIYRVTAYDFDGDYLDSCSGLTLRDALLELANDMQTADMPRTITVTLDEVEAPTAAEKLNADLVKNASPDTVASLCLGVYGQLTKQEINPHTGRVAYQHYTFPDGSRFFIDYEDHSWGPFEER